MQVYSVRLLVRLRWLPLPVFGSVFGIKIVPSVEHWYKPPSPHRHERLALQPEMLWSNFKELLLPRGNAKQLVLSRGFAKQLQKCYCVMTILLDVTE